MKKGSRRPALNARRSWKADQAVAANGKQKVRGDDAIVGLSTQAGGEKVTYLARNQVSALVIALHLRGCGVEY